MPRQSSHPTPLPVIFPTLPGDEGKLDTLGLSAGAWNTVYLSCWEWREWGMAVGWWREKGRKIEKQRDRKKKKEMLEKKVGGVFWNEGEEVLDFKELIGWSTYPEGSLKGLNHQLRFAEEQKRQSLVADYQMSCVLDCAWMLLQISTRLINEFTWVQVSAMSVDKRSREEIYCVCYGKWVNI